MYDDAKVIKRTNHGITFVKCHTIGDDSNIYIGPTGSKEKDWELIKRCKN